MFQLQLRLLALRRLCRYEHLPQRADRLLLLLSDHVPRRLSIPDQLRISLLHQHIRHLLLLLQPLRRLWLLGLLGRLRLQRLTALGKGEQKRGRCLPGRRPAVADIMSLAAKEKSGFGHFFLSRLALALSFRKRGNNCGNILVVALLRPWTRGSKNRRKKCRVFA